ncbi:MAG: DUF1810 family protein [Legionellaceae bacterium]|nr:DUF1810 family protein [Legionellaceae bacterium]
MPASINDFIKAQAKDYLKACQEIDKGQKASHWIWYIFPQLQTLGFSSTAKFYSIVGFKEACQYLQNPLLCKRYKEILEKVHKKLEEGLSEVTLMGSDTDARKLSSSLTLFYYTAQHLALEESNLDFQQVANLCLASLKRMKSYPACGPTIAFLGNPLNGLSSEAYSRIPALHLNDTILPALELPNSTFQSEKFPNLASISTPIVTLDPVSKPEPAVQPPNSESAPDKKQQNFLLKIRKELTIYILKRENEPQHFYQGLFKGYCKKDKLTAAIRLYILVDKNIQESDPIQKLMVKYKITPETVNAENIKQYLPILRQGRLGDTLRDLAHHNDNKEFPSTVRGLVSFLSKVFLANKPNTSAPTK